MRVLGVDPGTIRMGYGVVEDDNETPVALDYGAIAAPERSPIGERLLVLYKRLNEIVKRYRPEILAVEQPFISKNPRSALAIGRAQAVAILVAAANGVAVREYTPAQVKQRVASYGASSKEQVQEMVRLQLRLPRVPEPDDAADALAIALCHIGERHFSQLVGKGTKS
jgi:crossover junction endodeoxyribonuclease RuvC